MHFYVNKIHRGYAFKKNVIINALSAKLISPPLLSLFSRLTYSKICECVSNQRCVIDICTNVLRETVDVFFIPILLSVSQ